MMKEKIMKRFVEPYIAEPVGLFPKCGQTLRRERRAKERNRGI